MLPRPIPPMPMPAMFNFSLGGVFPFATTTCPGTMEKTVAAVVPVLMNDRRDSSFLRVFLILFLPVLERKKNKDTQFKLREKGKGG
jgi:hypothetical protein